MSCGGGGPYDDDVSIETLRTLSKCVGKWHSMSSDMIDSGGGDANCWDDRLSSALTLSPSLSTEPFFLLFLFSGGGETESPASSFAASRSASFFFPGPRRRTNASHSHSLYPRFVQFPQTGRSPSHLSLRAVGRW